MNEQAQDLRPSQLFDVRCRGCGAKNGEVRRIGHWWFCVECASTDLTQVVMDADGHIVERAMNEEVRA
jgi:hypothetical protein